MPQYLSSFSVFSPGFWYVVFAVGSSAQKWKKLHHSGVVIENMLKHIMHKPRFCWKQKAPVAAVGIFACSKILRQESCQDLVAYCHRCCCRARPVCVYEKEKPSQKWKQLSRRWRLRWHCHDQTVHFSSIYVVVIVENHSARQTNVPIFYREFRPSKLD